MPYIKDELRYHYEECLAESGINTNTPCGHLNYLLTCIVQQYLGPRPNYQRYCEVEGVLGHMAKELYRRRAAPYEDQKIKENGDVF